MEDPGLVCAVLSMLLPRTAAYAGPLESGVSPAAVLLLPAFVTTALACWGFRGFLPTGTPFGLLVLSPLQWQVLVLVPVIGVVAGFIGLRLYERLLHHRAATSAGT